MKRLLAPALLAIALTGCGGTGGSEPAPTPTTVPVGDDAAAPGVKAPEGMEPTPGGPGTWEFTTEAGAKVTLELPAEPAKVEAFRETVHAKPVTYAVFTVDNRDGSDSFSPYQMTVYDAAGKAYEFTDGAEAISEWGPHYTSDYEYLLNDDTVISEDKGDALYNQGVDLHNKYLQPIAKLQQGEQLLIGQFPELPEKFTGVEVVVDTAVPPVYAEPVSGQ